MSPSSVLRPEAAGDAIPPDCEIIEVRVSGLRQLFNAIDPSPFHERDIDPNAEQFITDWAGEIPGSASLALLVHVDNVPGAPDEAEILRDAVHQHFRRRAEATRRRLRVLFHRGRISLLIGLAFLAVTMWLASSVPGVTESVGLRALLREGLIISGWVAMWRPMEVFLYDWWPIHAEVKLHGRLAGMPVRIHYATSRRE